MRDLGPTDAFVSLQIIYLNRPGDMTWPEKVGPDVTPASPNLGAHECAERHDFTAHWGQLTQGGQGVWVVVAFGEDVSSDTTDQAWAVVNSFKVTESPSR